MLDTPNTTLRCYRCGERPRSKGKFCDGCRRELNPRTKRKAIRLAPIIPLPIPAPASPPPPRPEISDAERLDRFSFAWEQAWYHFFGARRKGLPWREFRFEIDRATLEDIGWYGGIAIWFPKCEMGYFIDPEVPVRRKVMAARHFAHYPYTAYRRPCDDVCGHDEDDHIVTRQTGKGVQATAAALWCARGDATKEGLVLCHALKKKMRKRTYNWHDGNRKQFAMAISDIQIPHLRSVGLEDPWHHFNNEMLPSGVVDAYEDLFSHRGFQIPASGLRHPKSDTGPFEALCTMALAEFMLSSFDHELVHIAFKPEATCASSFTDFEE